MIKGEKLSNTIALPKIREEGGVPKKVAEIKSKYDPEKYNIIYHTTKDQNEQEEEKKPKTSNSESLKKISPVSTGEQHGSTPQKNIKVRTLSSKDRQRNSEKEAQNLNGSGKGTAKEASGANGGQAGDALSYTQTAANNMDIIEEGRFSEYKNEEDELICYRFPHLEFCACPVNCNVAVNETYPIEVYNGIIVGSIVSAYCTKKLLRKNVTHVLNVSALEYTKRTRYFKYLTIDVYDTNDEDIKKHFRITNRFINEALTNKNKVLIHCVSGKSRALAFALAFLINSEKIPLKRGLEILKEKLPETAINPYFLKQLEQYDLEKLALVSIKKKL